MTKSCAAYGCTARHVAGGIRSFHRFPKNAALREKWIVATKRKNFTPSSGSYICSDHFVEEAFEKKVIPGFSTRRYLKQDAVPTVFAFPVTKKLKLSEPPQIRNCPQVTTDVKLTTDVENTKANAAINVSARVRSEAPRKTQTQTIRYVGDCASKDSDSLADVRRKLQFVLSAYQMQRRRVKGLMQQCRRMKRRFTSLKKMLSDLQDKKFINGQASTNLENIGPEVQDLIQRQVKGKVKVKYPPSLRTFALTLHSYSPKAYEYVRKTFDTCLPHPDTLKRWYSGVNGGQPGFTDEAFKILTSECQQQDKNEIICGPVMEEMSIQKQV